jgi:pyruvate ferredoxin oxidoreductase beta subunit
MAILASGHTMCAGCGVAIAMGLIGRACPKETIAVMATSCLEVCTTAYPLTAWNIPAIHVAFECTSAVASGIEAVVKRLGQNWKVLAIAGDGGTFDIGLQALSGMLERGHKVTQICLDNEAYMNTGIQRSGATPPGAWTTTTPSGKAESKKPIDFIVAAHGIPYVATASIGLPADLIAKVKKGLKLQPSFIHIHCPCPPGWKIDSNATVRIAKAAIESGMWPLLEIEYGKLTISKRPEKIDVADYLKAQGRFKALKEEDIEKIQKAVKEEWKKIDLFLSTNPKLIE